MTDISKKKAIGRLSWAVLAGILLGVVLACVAIFLLPTGNGTLAIVSLLVAAVSLFMSARADDAATWTEIGKRSARTWIGLGIGVAGFVLAFTALLAWATT